MKKYIVLLALSLTMCVPTAPAKESWPFEEKQNFISECFSRIAADGDLLKKYSTTMLKNICDCTADELERSYDWDTFSEITQPPLTKETERKFFITSYECALAEKTKEFI